MMRIRWIAAAAAVAALVGAPSAMADSIAYVKDGNVWLSTSDGARQYQVTGQVLPTSRRQTTAR